MSSAGSRGSSERNSARSGDIDKQLNDLMGAEDENEQQKRRQQFGEETGENVSVMVRCRPLSTSEQRQGEQQAVQVDEANRCVQVDNERRFFFDQVFDVEASNEMVYMKSARRLVEAAFRGYNCAVFLYGQTGTGKTFTHSSMTTSAFEHLFGLIQDSNKQASFLIRASYYELYNEEIRDLLASGGGNQGKRGGKALELHESKTRGVYIKDLTSFLVNNLSELNRLKQVGDKRRATAATKMNEHSSRSHSIFSITIETTTTTTTTTMTTGEKDEALPIKRRSTSTSDKKQSGPSRRDANLSSLRLGRLHLIDLAGSERQSKSGSSGLQLREASRINLSLTCLALVIRALTDNSNNNNNNNNNNSSSQPPKHIPYRNSKLTRLLSSSLGGNSKTLLMACISPARCNLDETLSTLRFAARTKQIKNRAVINEDPKDALLRKYRRQLRELRERLGATESEINQKAGATAATPSAGARQTTADRVLALEMGDNLPAGDKQREQEQQQQHQLMEQLELLKAKIMFGGENLLDKAELHERLLEASRQELEERQEAEKKLRLELKNKEHSIASAVHSKGSLESQRNYLEERLTKAIELYRRSKLEMRDLISEHDQLKEQLLMTIKSTSREIKYTDCILDDFIPREYLDLINAYAQYDDESEEWQIKYIASSGNNIAQTRRLAALAGTTGGDATSVNELGAAVR